MTVNDLLYFLNEIDFSDKLDNDHHAKIKQVKKNKCKRN